MNIIGSTMNARTFATKMDFLLRTGDDSTLVLVVGRFHKRYVKTELNRMKSIEAVVFATMSSIWKFWNGKSQKFDRDGQPSPEADALPRHFRFSTHQAVNGK